MTRNAGERCARCCVSMTEEIVESPEPLVPRLLSEAPAITAGYVKENTTFMITDDLEI